MHKVRVLALGPVPPPYHGVATYLSDLLSSTDLNGVALQHLDTSDRRDASNLGRWDCENLSLGFANLADLAERCARSDAAIVYLPLSQSVPAFLRDALFIIQSRLMGKHVVVHLHGGYFRMLYDQQGAAFQSLARAALGCVSAAIVLGENFRGIFAGLVADERIHVVENGVRDFEAQHNGNTPRRPACLLYMSTLTRTKGILELVEALGILRNSAGQIRLRVAGAWQDAGLREEVAETVQRLSLQHFVEIAGNVTGSAKAEFLASGDIFCLPTRYPYEGQPLVILEAMAAGLPVLTTDRGAIAATVLDGVTGRVLPESSTAEQIAAALKAMLEDRERLSSYGRLGRERYLDRYTLHMCHENLAYVFRTVAGTERE